MIKTEPFICIYDQIRVDYPVPLDDNWTSSFVVIDSQTSKLYDLVELKDQPSAYKPAPTEGMISTANTLYGDVTDRGYIQAELLWNREFDVKEIWTILACPSPFFSKIQSYFQQVPEVKIVQLTDLNETDAQSIGFAVRLTSAGQVTLFDQIKQWLLPYMRFSICWSRVAKHSFEEISKFGSLIVSEIHSSVPSLNLYSWAKDMEYNLGDQIAYFVTEHDSWLLTGDPLITLRQCDSELLDAAIKRLASTHQRQVYKSWLCPEIVMDYIWHRKLIVKSS